MPTVLKIIATLALALALHLALGWVWTPLAGIVAGYWVGRRGWLAGMAAVGGGWLLLVLYNFAAAPEATSAMLAVFGGILGNLPGAAIVGLTLLIAALLGSTSGLAGSRLARLTSRTAGSAGAPTVVVK